MLIILLIQIIAISAACSPPSCIHGKCNSGTCECFPGWEGIFCTNLTICSAPCHSGLCVADTCTCINTWSGPKCDKEDDCPISCVNGICEGSVCYCQNGWTGIACEVENICSNTCDKGECFAGECYCQDGYTGESCDVIVAEEISNAKEETGTSGIVVYSVAGVIFVATWIHNYKVHKRGEEDKAHQKEVEIQLKELTNHDNSDTTLVIKMVESDEDEDEVDVEGNNINKGTSTPRILSASRIGSTYNLRMSSHIRTPSGNYTNPVLNKSSSTSFSFSQDKSSIINKSSTSSPL